MTHYSELQKLIKKYGEETIALVKGSKHLGDKILSELPDYLECDRTKVNGVPPNGEFQPNVDYRDACRSTHSERISYLEPVEMGICVKIDNLGDHGSTWVRTVLSIWIQDQKFVVHVGEQEKRVTIPSDLTSGFTDLFEAIHEDVKQAFSLELDDVTRPRRIGFITD